MLELVRGMLDLLSEDLRQSPVSKDQSLQKWEYRPHSFNTPSASSSVAGWWSEQYGYTEEKARDVSEAQKPGSSLSTQWWKEREFHKGLKRLLFKGTGHLQRPFVKLRDGSAAPEDKEVKEWKLAAAECFVFFALFCFKLLSLRNCSQHTFLGSLGHPWEPM